MLDQIFYDLKMSRLDTRCAIKNLDFKKQNKQKKSKQYPSCEKKGSINTSGAIFNQKLDNLQMTELKRKSTK